MSKKLARGAAAGMLAAVALLGAVAPAAAADQAPKQSGDDEVVIVDEPDTSNLNNQWTTMNPAGVPVLGLLDSLMSAPQKLLPGGGGY